MYDERKARRSLSLIFSSTVLRRLVVGIFAACLCALMFVQVLDTIAGKGSLLDLVMNSLVFALVVGGFFLFRHLFRTVLNFDVDDLNPPLGWTPSMPEGFANQYRGFQMRVNEDGQLVPAGGKSDPGKTPAVKGHPQAYSAAVGAAEAAGGQLSYYATGTDGDTRVAPAPAKPASPAKSTSKKASTKRRVLAAPRAGKAVDTQVEVGPLLRSDGSLPTPQEIYAALGEYVIGQEDAKKTLSVAVYNHYKRTMADVSHSDVEIAKSNIMLLGPTGSGKTLMVQTLARILDVPLAIADATTMTDAGYVGDDVESMLGRLIATAGSVENASLGIVYVDEIDKIARKTSSSTALNGDPSGEGVQQAMLKLLEGSVSKVPPLGGRTNLFQKDSMLDTTNILFICGGAFVGLTDIVRKRLGRHSVGFAADSSSMEELTDNDLLALVEPQDLHQYGLIPEFIGRIPITTHTNELDAAAMVRILTEPKNALVRQYQELFAYDGIQLDFDRAALEAIGDEALERGTGARGLRSICERVLRDAMFELPGRSDVQRVVVHRACVTDGEALEYMTKETHAGE